uniref:Uncharacterized protein n=1 Tax=viral metagenome TaxID=1070528 RepID=A0A6C0EE07_9ZZZZ
MDDTKEFMKYYNQVNPLVKLHKLTNHYDYDLYRLVWNNKNTTFNSEWWTLDNMLLLDKYDKYFVENDIQYDFGEKVDRVALNVKLEEDRQKFFDEFNFCETVDEYKWLYYIINNYQSRHLSSINTDLLEICNVIISLNDVQVPTFMNSQITQLINKFTQIFYDYKFSRLNVDFIKILQELSENDIMKLKLVILSRSTAADRNNFWKLNQNEKRMQYVY